MQNGEIFYVGSAGDYTFQQYMTNTGQNKQIKYVCNNGLDIDSWFKHKIKAFLNFFFLGYTLIGSSGSTCVNGNWKPSLNTAKCIKGLKFKITYLLNLFILYHRQTFE